MYEHDTVLNNAEGMPSVSYGPRHEVGDDSVEPCPPGQADFWSVYIHPNYDIEANWVGYMLEQSSAELIARSLHAYRDADKVTRLPDGSAFSVGKFPLPKDHWLYVPDSQSFEPNAMLTEGQRAHFEMRAREAIRRATASGKDMDFDPDALVQNLSVLVCGEYPLRAKVELTPQHQGYSEADMGDQPDRYK